MAPRNDRSRAQINYCYNIVLLGRITNRYQNIFVPIIGQSWYYIAPTGRFRRAYRSRPEHIRLNILSTMRRELCDS
jgi:hypothetical protein